MADLFHDDPNFDVQVDIKFKNSASNGGANLALLNHLSSARRLTQVDLNKMIAPKNNSKGVLRNANVHRNMKKPERRLVIDSHRSKIDMHKFDMPKNLY